MTAFSGPIFIVGMPRSGTKLLRGLLNAHPRIHIPLNETEFLPSWERRWASFGDLANHRRFADFYAQVTQTFYFAYRQREHGQQIDMGTWYCACNGDFSLPNVFECLLRHDSAAGAGDIWGDKSPSYIAHIPLLLRLYPQAKIIHIVRDARDYALSIEKAFGKSRLRAAHRWAELVTGAFEQQQRFPEAVHLLRYEDLLDETASHLKELCAFIGVDYTPEMLSLGRSPENLGDTIGAVQVVAGNHGKYLQQMTVEEREEIEAFCAKGLSLAGYPVSYRGDARRLSAFELRKHQLTDVAQLIRRDAKNRGWRTAIRGRLTHYFRLNW